MWNPLSLLRSYINPNLQIARHALGKYIIGFACVLHLGWAVLLCIDKRAGNATPLSVMFALMGNDRFAVVFCLVAVALMAGAFLDMRLRKSVNLSVLSMLLIPQQAVLLCSAFAGLYATFAQHYADGVMRSWSHILADQLAIILMAVLYTIAVLETRQAPLYMRQGEQGDRGPKGDKGAKGDKGDRGIPGMNFNDSRNRS